MNPNAKEFVPAHILRKRQEEEAKRLGELSEKLDKVVISSNKKEENEDNKESCTVGGDKKNEQATKSVQVENPSNTTNHYNSKSKSQNENEEAADNQENDHHHHHNHNNNSNEHEYPEGLHEFIEQDEDDRYLLRAGEDLCEFNGEQFIIPGDDELDQPVNAGFDFGNAEDNEDEDVCNAFAEFLDNLPN